MAALLIVAVCVLVLLGVALNGFLLWLSCKICRVARPAAAPGGKPRGIGYGRALLCTIGIAIISDLAGLAGYFALSPLLPPAASPTLPNFLVLGLADLCLSLIVQVLFLRFTLPTTLGKSVLVALLWNAFSAVFGVVLGVVLGVVARMTAVEALILPTGGMAETVRGYHKEVVCPQCGYTFAVNCSQQMDPTNPPGVWVSGCTCPNCRQHIAFAPPTQPAGPPAAADPNTIPDPAPAGGDRLVAGRGFLGPDFFPPRRTDLVVFQYPVDPSHPPVSSQPVKYLQRLIGLPGETVAIHGGDLYVLPPDRGPKYDDKDANPSELWEKDYTHENDPEALELFREGAFEILRKAPDDILTMKEIVYDADHPAKDSPPRWADRDGGAAWKADGAHGFRLAAPSDDKVHWLGYRHVLPDAPDKPQLVTDFTGYNTGEPPRRPSGVNWAGDLILECEVQADQPQGELTLELSKGVDRLRARFDLATGGCKLLRVQGDKEETLDDKPTPLKGGSHHVRLANVDRRLTVWVDDALPFGDGVAYDPPEAQGPTKENDLEPAAVGLKGTGATVRGLRLWRDTYYTTANNRGDPSAPDVAFDPTDPTTWKGLQHPPTKTLYVQPKHYLCLGDNSPQSSDGRMWGLVPQRLLLGKALAVYYPFDRFGRIR